MAESEKDQRESFPVSAIKKKKKRKFTSEKKPPF